MTEPPAEPDAPSALRKSARHRGLRRDHLRRPPEGRPSLICGAAGCGKTLFATTLPGRRRDALRRTRRVHQLRGAGRGSRRQRRIPRLRSRRPHRTGTARHRPRAGRVDRRAPRPRDARTRRPGAAGAAPQQQPCRSEREAPMSPEPVPAAITPAAPRPASSSRSSPPRASARAPASGSPGVRLRQAIRRRHRRRERLGRGHHLHPVPAAGRHRPTPTEPADEPEPLARATAPVSSSSRTTAMVGAFATQALAELGYGTVWAWTRDRALAERERTPERFDVVFTDVVMPGMNGVDLARAIQARRPDMRWCLVGLRPRAGRGRPPRLPLLHKTVFGRGPVADSAPGRAAEGDAAGAERIPSPRTRREGRNRCPRSDFTGSPRPRGHIPAPLRHGRAKGCKGGRLPGGPLADARLDPRRRRALELFDALLAGPPPATAASTCRRAGRRSPARRSRALPGCATPRSPSASCAR